MNNLNASYTVPAIFDPSFRDTDVETKTENTEVDAATFNHLLYAGVNETDHSDLYILVHNEKYGLRYLFNKMRLKFPSLDLYRHPKNVLLSIIDSQTLSPSKTNPFLNQNSFCFVVVQAARPLSVLPYEITAKYQDHEDQTDSQNRTFVKPSDHFTDYDNILSVRAVIKIEKHVRRVCPASEIVYTYNDKISRIPSNSYGFTIKTVKGNPNGFAVMSLLKGLGFKRTSNSEHDIVYSNYLNSLLWFGEHQKEVEVLLAQDQCLIDKNENPGASFLRSRPIHFAMRKNKYNRSLKKAIIR